MAARIPLLTDRSVMAENLEQCVIGPQTAMEINWIKATPAQ
ncbi:hypothetical protein [Methylomarinum vadi]|nr:hypothetical protein [Methylomarinum vadi]